ncbi:hypothetical protein GXW82_12065 [Streptacidiphilus sp. 4-A2]|nr:hypothetical protein [Streptacidiphilus sp. 4-A2]
MKLAAQKVVMVMLTVRKRGSFQISGGVPCLAKPMVNGLRMARLNHATRASQACDPAPE